MSSYSQNHKRDLTALVFAVVYVVVGVLLIYLNYTGSISSTLFGVGIFVLIAASLLFKYATDFSKKRR
ncbi:MAG: hypothetical protein NWF00_01920 [Candidatus Bathyarchaeota archaeon]|nr:hypothetical protein [Candidatus Bathyarchaeota archaeon]